jgi:cell wall-associated NlpC family hydrolase
MSRVIDIARTHLGTPWRHLGRLPGVALDCVGEIYCTGREAGALISDVQNYGRCPNPRRFLTILASQLDRVSGPEPLSLIPDLKPLSVAGPSDIVVLYFDDRALIPQHVGWKTDRGLLHTAMNVGKVTEVSDSPEWHRQVHSIWRLRWPR